MVSAKQGRNESSFSLGVEKCLSSLVYLPSIFIPLCSPQKFPRFTHARKDHHNPRETIRNNNKQHEPTTTHVLPLVQYPVKKRTHEG